MAERRRIPVAVVNGAGYGGVELLRLLRSHPAFELVEVTARSDAGKPVRAVFPHLVGLDLTFGERVERAELVFLALPDHASVELAPELLAEGRRVVDLSAGFRLRDERLYPTWYGYEHSAPALLETAVYGLTEWAREQLPEARLVACPGCYPTAALLALGPALKEHLIAPDVIVDAISGVSGAGRTLRLTSHFSEVNEDVTAYGVGGHRHWPEILQGIREVSGDVSGKDARLTFTPHLAPMTRGILATCYANVREGVTLAAVRAAYERAYAQELFVAFVTETPHTKWTLGSNRCFVSATVDEHSQRLILISALDNLVKGAAGQAIQCANVMYGLPETLGLPLEGVYP
ncbi:MAG TPA: N-acetyl-gamma-glutamyl-phosphate reductase [Ktedonobacterales bacterium]|jgi:N-acetyl-gamma-glutamyl-phosphate reductase|nr:N-acetyl-gamma-glutamyl-phosphate reductase [Ktedonobacterales bacterium]